MGVDSAMIEFVCEYCRNIGHFACPALQVGGDYSTLCDCQHKPRTGE